MARSIRCFRSSRFLNWSALLATASFVPALLAIGSCSDDPLDPHEHYRVGAVEGYVRVVGKPAVLSVGAVPRSGTNQNAIVALTTSDSTGWYRLDLPAGPYELQIGPDRYRLDRTTPPDTVTITTRIVRLDLIRSGAEVTLLMPAELEGHATSVVLKAASRSNVVSDRVRSGVAIHDFTLVKPGTYGLGVNVSGSWVDVADSLVIAANAVATRTLDFRTSYASVSGHVTGSWQQATDVSMRVQAISTAGRWLAHDVPLQSDGSYTLDLLAPQPVRVFAQCGGISQWIGGDSEATAQVFDVGPGDRITGADLVESGMEITLSGFDDLSSYNGELLVRDEGGVQVDREPLYGSTAYVCNLRPGRYYVHVDPECYRTWAPQWYDGAEQFADAKPIELRTGELRQVTLDLVEGGRIEGLLLTAEGERAPSTIYSGICDGARETVCSKLLENGVFRYTGLADGEYYLSVVFDNQYLWWYPGTKDFGSATPIRIARHGSVTGLTWNLPAAGKGAQP